MGAYPVPVDVEQLVIAYLVTHPDLQAILGDRFYSKIPKEPTFPLAVLHRFGGAHVRLGWLDRALLQFDVWGETKKSARDAAAAVYAAMCDAPATNHDLGVLTAVQDVSGLAWLPDPDAGARPRYSFSQAVYVHPNP